MVKDAKDKVKAQRLAEAEEAKKNLVSQYLHLGSAMKRCAAAVDAFATALNETDTNEEMLALLRAPASAPMPSMPDALPFLGAVAEASSNGKKRSKSEEGDEPEKKRGGKEGKRAKKEKDVNAPKRPPSAYLLFQNAVRDEIKGKNPDLKYLDVIAKVGEAWGELGESGQAPYKEATELAMNKWKTELAAYEASKGLPAGSAVADVVEVDEFATPAAAAEKKAKKPTKKEEKAAAEKEKVASELIADKPTSKKDSAKAKKTPAAATPATPAAASKPASKTAAAPKSAKKSAPPPPPPAESSSSEESSEEEGSDSDSDSD